MNKIQFAVSAKTARLIGRENISDVDGAIIELIKNSYDADATCVLVLFNIPFPHIPKSISYELSSTVFSKDEISQLMLYYSDNGKELKKLDNLSAEQESKLGDFLYSKNAITIVDNGQGMDEKILRTAWMNIGTNDKEENRVSVGGRVKTGAKGIGRFALDKLSKTTTVLTKNNNDILKRWSINWEQFETASLLDEVTATIDDCDGTFSDYVSNIARDNFKAINNYDWDTGTIIRLSPTREVWSEQYFSKVNRNLKSLFPSTNNSQFDIYITNVFYPKHSFTNERFSLNESEFDYKIIGSFDGDDKISISISRNEIDTRKLKINRTIDETEYSFLLNEFWNRDAFKQSPYIRSDFSKTVNYSFSANALTKIDTAVLQSVGAFSVELYFIKNAPSTIEIVKPVISTRRKNLLNNFSGIKLYRDGFKVRPYGEQDGPSFDWLSLGLRAQKSPASVSHPNGSWRVRSNQIIGEVRITKDGNPNLMDKANREGLAINDSYHAFVSLIDKIIETFEADRQYVFKEYSQWIKSKENEVSKTSNIVEEAKKKTNSTEGTTPSPVQKANDENDKNFSKEDYERAVLALEQEREQQERATKTMMLYSSAGVMTNTFSHEISRITTQAGSRMQHLRYAVKKSIGEEYNGNKLFNPYPIIDQVEAVDKLLENWLDVIMAGTSDDVFSKRNVNIYSSIREILATWQPLLEKKLISVTPIELNGKEDDCVCTIAEIDLRIIMNNFLLNSSEFLEQATVPERKISISITDERNRLIIILENNGPPLDSIYSNNPDKIFDAGVSSKVTEKGKGSGIGLWIARTLILNNSGEIHSVQKNDGFALKISLPK